MGLNDGYSFVVNLAKPSEATRLRTRHVGRESFFACLASFSAVVRFALTDFTLSLYAFLDAMELSNNLLLFIS